ncbi:GNAT family N-acetyltransferase [Kiloniella majae]|uniref:GNAT family N-acetyltransferase n=1 Tax=Kiloniella majae TaxID=1938558 RepID=UPI0018E96E06|nr:GNAT family N-acetyltransferase [Kiloniella majae]
MTIEILQADTQTIHKVVECFDLYRQFYGQESDRKACEVFLSERQDSSESVVFYAQNNSGDVLGFTQIYPTFSSVSLRRDLILNDLFVHEKARGQGVARKLLTAARDHGKKVNSKGILLETDILNAKAQSLYESFGFERETDHYFYYLTI